VTSGPGAHGTPSASFRPAFAAAAARLTEVVYPGANGRSRSWTEPGERFMMATRRAKPKLPLPIIDASWRR
jgi:hypothetical protein